MLTPTVNYEKKRFNSLSVFVQLREFQIYLLNDSACADLQIHERQRNNFHKTSKAQTKVINLNKYILLH